MKELEEIFADYQNIRDNYRNFTKNGDGAKEVLVEYEGRFTDIKADLTFWKSKYLNEYTKRDDKYLTAFKSRIILMISRGEFVDSTGEKYDKMSLSSAEKIAGGTHMYMEFIKSRPEFKEYYVNISDVREDVSSYVNEIKDRLKILT